MIVTLKKDVQIEILGRAEGAAPPEPANQCEAQTPKASAGFPLMLYVAREIDDQEVLYVAYERSLDAAELHMRKIVGVYRFDECFEINNLTRIDRVEGEPE